MSMGMGTRGGRALLLAAASALTIAAGRADARDVAAVVGAGVGSADAFEVARFLSERGGYSDDAVLRPAATAARIGALFPQEGRTGTLEAAARGEAPGRALFYYSGAGARGEDGRAWLLGERYGGRVALDDVLAGMAALGARETLVVLESSFDGAAVTPPPGVTVVLAADAGQAAQRDAAGLGLFTLALLDGATTTADASGDGVVSAGEAGDFAARALDHWSTEKAGRPAQTPVILGSEGARLAVATSPRWKPGAGDADRAWLDQAEVLRIADAASSRARRADRGGGDEPDFRLWAGRETPRGGRDRKSLFGSDGGSRIGWIAAGGAGLALAALAAGGGGGGGSGSAAPGPTSPPPTSPPPTTSPPPVSGTLGTAGVDRYVLNGQLTSPVLLLGGDDVAEIQGGGFAAGAYIDGGEGADTIETALRSIDLGLHGADAPLRNFEILHLTSPFSVTLANTGAIGLVEWSSADNELILPASTVLKADVALGDGSDIVRLDGTIDGDVRLGAGDDHLILETPSGALLGDLDLGEGNDNFVLYGAFDGALDFGSGDDTFYLGRLWRRDVVMGDGANGLTVNGTGDLEGAVRLGAGNDAYTVLGAARGEVDLGAGNDQLRLVSYVSGAGRQEGNAALGDGDDTVTVDGANLPDQLPAVFAGDIDTGAGADEVVLGGKVEGSVRLGPGDDRFDQEGGAVTGVVDAGEGTDVYVLAPPFSPFNPGAPLTTFDLGAFGGPLINFEQLQVSVENTAPAVTLTGSAKVSVRVATSAGVKLDPGAVVDGDMFLSSAVGARFTVGEGVVTGVVEASPNTIPGDRLVLAATQPGFDLGQIGVKYRNFDIIDITAPDSVVLSGTETTPIQVQGGEDRDVVRVTGVLTGSLFLGGGADTLTIGPGAVLKGSASSGEGDDVVVFEGDLADTLQGSIVGDRGDTIEIAPTGTLRRIPSALLAQLASFGGYVVTGGAVAPEGVGATLSFPDTVWSLGFRAGPTGGPARLLIDWGPGDVYDRVSVRAGGAATIESLLVTFNEIPGGSIAAGKSADLVSAGTVTLAPGALQFAGLDAHPGLAVVPVVRASTSEPLKQVLHVDFCAAPCGASATSTPQTVSGAALLTAAALGSALDAAGGLAASAAGSASLGLQTTDGWAPAGPAGLRAGATRRAFLSEAGGTPVQTTAQAARSFVGGPILGGLATAGLGAGVEETFYLGAGEAGARSRGRARAGYLAAYLGTDVGAWRIDAAMDAGPLSFDFEGPLMGGAMETSGRRARAELAGSRQVVVAGAPLEIDLGLRWADLETDPFRRGDGLWTAGPAARFTSGSLGVALADVWGFSPYARASAVVDGAGEEWRLVGLRRAAPIDGLTLDASVGEVSAPLVGDSAKGEVRLDWKF